MTLFWTLSALLILLGLGILAPSLWRGRAIARLDRDADNIRIARERLTELENDLEEGRIEQAQFEQTKLELEAVLASDLTNDDSELSADPAPGRASLAVIALALPLLAVLTYYYLGAPDYVDVAGAGAGQPTTHAGAEGEELPPIDEMVATLAERMKQNPEDPDGWYMLGRSYMSMGRFDEAVDAFEHLYELVGEHPTAMVMLADAVAMSQNGSMQGRPEELVLGVLEITPDDPTALWLAGRAAAERGDPAQAVHYWRRARPYLAESPEMQAELDGLIQQAVVAAGGNVPEEPGEKPLPTIMGSQAQAKPSAAPQAAAGGASLQVSVSLAPELAARVQPGDTVFVFARAAQGPAMPLAVVRHQAQELPLEVTLDDSMAMMPQMTLSSQEQVLVGARISRSGNAMPQSGDLESELVSVAPADAGPLTLSIDRQRP